MGDPNERECPLPVFRKEYSEEDDTYKIVTGICMSPLYTDYEETRYLMTDGEYDSCGPNWKVTCEAGHVLVVPDHEGDDTFTQIPWDIERVNDALRAIKTEPFYL